MATNLKLNYAIHPGVFLADELESLKITQRDLAARIDEHTSVISDVINGKRKISAPLAVKLERVFSFPASYWMNLQGLYDISMARIKEEEKKHEITFTKYDNTQNVHNFGGYKISVQVISVPCNPDILVA